MAGYNARGAGRKAKLTSEQIEEVRRRYESGERLEKLSRELGVTRQTMSSWLHKAPLENQGFITELSAWKKKNREFLKKSSNAAVDIENYTLRVEIVNEQGVLAVLLVDLARQKVELVTNVANPVLSPFGVSKKITWEDFEVFLSSRVFEENRVDAAGLLESLSLPQYQSLRILQKTGGKLPGDDLTIRLIYYVKNKPDLSLLKKVEDTKAKSVSRLVPNSYQTEKLLLLSDGEGYEALASIVATNMLKVTQRSADYGVWEPVTEADRDVVEKFFEKKDLTIAVLEENKKEQEIEISVSQLHYRLMGSSMETVLSLMKGPRERLQYLITFLERVTGLSLEQRICELFLLDDFFCVRGRKLSDIVFYYDNETDSYRWPAFVDFSAAFFARETSFPMELSADRCYEQVGSHLLNVEGEYQDAIAAVRERIPGGISFGISAEDFLHSFQELRTKLELICENEVKGKDPLTVISSMRLWRKRFERVESVLRMQVRRHGERFFN